MRKRWKWLVTGLVVLMLGAFLMIPVESDGLEAFRRLGPVREETSSAPAMRIGVFEPTNRMVMKNYEIYAKTFTYGPLSDSDLAALKKAYRENSRTNFIGLYVQNNYAKSGTEFGKERSVVSLNIMKAPSKWDELWAKVMAFFGRS